MNIIWWYHILSQKQTIPWCSHKRSCQQNWLLKIQNDSNINCGGSYQNQNSEYLRLHIVDLHINQVDIDQFIEYPKNLDGAELPLQNVQPSIFFRSILWVGWDASQESRQHGIWVCLKIGCPKYCIQLFVIIVPICSNIFVAISGVYPIFYPHLTGSGRHLTRTSRRPLLAGAQRAGMVEH